MIHPAFRRALWTIDTQRERLKSDKWVHGAAEADDYEAPARSLVAEALLFAHNCTTDPGSSAGRLTTIGFSTRITSETADHFLGASFVNSHAHKFASRIDN